MTHNKINLLSSVCILPYRQPVLTAKILATIDVLSNGRLIVGCGAGWMEEEFEALGLDTFKKRGAVTNEYINAFKELWGSTNPRFKGNYVSFSDIYFAPKPIQKPYPPIWIGGESPAAIRRAANYGDVWYPFGNNPQYPLDTIDRLKEGISKLNFKLDDANRDINTIYVALSAEMWYSDTDTTFDENGNSIKVLSIKVTVIDSGGYTAIGNFQVRIEDTNDVPTDIILSGQTFSIDFSGGEIVGKLIVEDQDLDETP